MTQSSCAPAPVRAPLRRLTGMPAWALAGLLALGHTPPAGAEEGMRHYEALPADNLAEALENFVTYNRRMDAILARESLGAPDMEEVHELTYTLETALARMLEELRALGAVLEEVHLASEGDNPARLRGVAEVYLEQARLFAR
ncbi:MAG: hypothetical protein Kow0058_15540 [Roseovarius sp.]